MARSTARDKGRGRSGAAGLVLAAEADRVRAFRQARLHSAVVRTLRVALPAAALGMCAYYGLALKLATGINGFTLPTLPEVRADDLVMHNPRYEGFNKDGGRYVVTAKSAQQDLRNRKAPVQLVTIDGKLTQPDQSVTDLKATRGTFDTAQNQLELFDGIEVASQSGMKAALSRATVFVKEHRIVSHEPVAVDMPTASVRARQLLIEQSSRQVTFSEGVTTRLTPEAKSSDGNAGKAASAAMPRGIGTSNAPVDITSERLEIDDTSKLATFRGNVRAVQGESTLETAALEVQYEGSATSPTAAPRPAAGAQPDAASKLKRIVSRTPVVLTQGTDRATGDSAEFDSVAETAKLIGKVVMTSGVDRRAVADRADMDQKHDIILLTGAVHVTQARNELKGRRLWVDRKTGRAQLTSPAELGGNGRTFTRLYQNEGKEGQPKKAAPAAAPANESVGAIGLGNMTTDPSAPIDIDAASLDINDTARTAIFRGDVRANQAGFKIVTPEMTAFYNGQTGLSMASPSAGRDTQAKPQTQLTKVEARKGVQVTTKDGQTVNGDWADFDVKANTVTIGGNVKLAQGQSIGSGGKLVIDLTTGENRLLPDTSNPLVAAAKRLVPLAGRPGTKATASEPQIAVPGQQMPFTPGASGRPSMVIDAAQMKGFHKQKDGKAAEAAQPAQPTAQGAPGETPARRRAVQNGEAAGTPPEAFAFPSSN